jgi:hypothetical protein
MPQKRLALQTIPKDLFSMKPVYFLIFNFFIIISLNLLKENIYSFQNNINENILTPALP